MLHEHYDVIFGKILSQESYAMQGSQTTNKVVLHLRGEPVRPALGSEKNPVALPYGK